MRDVTYAILHEFPTVWEVDLDPDSDDGVMVRVHASPRTEICDVTLSRLVASLFPNVSYVLCVIYHWAERRLESLLFDTSLDAL